MEDLVTTLLQHAPYIGVVAVLLLSGFGLPLPEDIPLLVGGYLCHTGHANIWIMVPVALAAVLLADSILFWIGRKYGYQVTRLPLLRHVLTEEALTRAERNYHLHGGKTLFLMRFVPGVRAAAFFTAGAFKIPFWKLLVFDGAAATISVPALVLAAFFFGEHFDVVKEWARNAGGIVALLIVLSVAGFVVLHYRRKRKAALEHHIVHPPRALPANPSKVKAEHGEA